jgi:hypothetical protein
MVLPAIQNLPPVPEISRAGVVRGGGFKALLETCTPRRFVGSVFFFSALRGPFLHGPKAQVVCVKWPAKLTPSGIFIQ